MNEKKRRTQRGFTLIELLAVMAIMAVLVGVVAPAVTGTRDASVDAQVLQDATQVRSAASDYYGDQNEAEVRTPHTITTTSLLPGVSQEVVDTASPATGVGETTAQVQLTKMLQGFGLSGVISIESDNGSDNPSASSYDPATKKLTVAGLAAGVEGADATRTLTVMYYGAPPAAVVTAQQITSSRWPERFISLQVAAAGAVAAAPANVVAIGSGYAQVIPTSPADNIIGVRLTDNKGLSISGDTLLTRYTAIDIKALVDSGYLQQAPAGSELASDGIPNFLWLFEKGSSASDRSDDNRQVAVFKLVKVDQLEGQAAHTELVNATDGTVTSRNATHADKVRMTYQRIF